VAVNFSLKEVVDFKTDGNCIQSVIAQMVMNLKLIILYWQPAILPGYFYPIKQ